MGEFVCIQCLTGNHGRCYWLSSDGKSECECGQRDHATIRENRDGHAANCSWIIMPAPDEEPCDGGCLTGWTDRENGSAER